MGVRNGYALAAFLDAGSEDRGVIVLVRLTDGATSTFELSRRELGEAGFELGWVDDLPD
jgi:hypothetical protein